MKNKDTNDFVLFLFLLANLWFVGVGIEKVTEKYGLALPDYTNVSIFLLLLNIVAVIAVLRAAFRKES